jgi:hypothetical protein
MGFIKGCENIRRFIKGIKDNEYLVLNMSRVRV